MNNSNSDLHIHLLRVLLPWFSPRELVKSEALRKLSSWWRRLCPHPTPQPVHPLSEHPASPLLPEGQPTLMGQSTAISIRPDTLLS